MAVWQTLVQTLGEAMCPAQALPPHSAPWDLRGYHSDDKNDSEKLSVLSLRNYICFMELSSYSIGIQIKKAGVRGPC